MPETNDELSPQKKRRKTGGPNDPRPVASVSLQTNYLADQLRRDSPGQWSADRLNQSQHDDGVSYVAINALMTAIRSSTVQINRKRKPVAFDSESGIGSRLVKSMSTSGTPTDSKKWVPFDDEKHALVKLLAMPNGTETINELLAQLVQQIMLTGSGLIWLNVDRLTLPQELYVIPTALAQAQPPAPQYPYGYWRVTQFYPAGAYGLLPSPAYGGGVPIDARNILRFKQPHPLWRWDALSPLTAGGVQLTILEAIDQARFSAMESGMTTDAFITAMGQSQEQMNAWMEQVKQNNVGKRNHRKIMALGGESSEKGDVKVTFPNASARDMDYSGGWDQMSGFALSLFGVPKAVANFTDASSYAQLFAALKQFHTLTLVPLANWLSKWLTLHLCQKCYGPEFSIQIDVPAIDDADMAEKKRSTNLQNNLLTFNEARAEINMPPMEGGDELLAGVFVQVQTAKAMAAAQPQPAPGQPPAVDPATGQPADAAQSTAAPGESLPTDPLSSLTGEGRDPDSESLPDETQPQDAGDDTDSTQDAVTDAALSALGITSDKGEQDEPPIQQNRITKAYLTNGNGRHLKAAIPVTKPGGAAKPKSPTGTPNPGAGAHKHQEGEKWQGPSGHWFTIKNKRAVPTSAPGAATSPSPTSGAHPGGIVNLSDVIQKQFKGNATKAGEAIAARVAQHLAAGGKVTAHFDGKSIPITSGDGGVLRDNKGQPWGTTALAMSRSDLKHGLEFHPVQSSPSESLPASPSRSAGGAKQAIAAHLNVPAAPSLDAQVKKLLNGQPSVNLMVAGSDGKIRGHKVTDAASLKAFYADGGKLGTLVLDDAVKSVPVSTPVAHAALSSVDTWAAQKAAKHVDDVARHFNISPARAHAILVAAIKQVAAHAAATGKQAGIAIKHNGKTIGLGPKKPPMNPSGAPSIPKPANAAGKGSLPPRFGKAIDGVSYGCVMLSAPKDVAEVCRYYIEQIDARDLIEPEYESHITAIYGLTPDVTPEDVSSIVEQTAPIPLTFGRFSIFTSAEHDVLKVEVESLPLRRLNSELVTLPHESKYHDYIPHLTIARLSPGTGQYYADMFDSFPIPHGVATEAVYSDADHTRTTIPLAGHAVTKAAMSYLSTGTGGALVAPAAQTPITVRGKKKRKRPLALVCKSVLAELDGVESAPPELLPEFASLIAKAVGAIAPRQEGEKWEGDSGRWFTLKSGHVVPTSAPGASESPSSSPHGASPEPANRATPARSTFTPEQLQTRQTVADIGAKLRDGEPVSPQEKQAFNAGVKQLPSEDQQKVAKAVGASPEASARTKQILRSEGMSANDVLSDPDAMRAIAKEYKIDPTIFLAALNELAGGGTMATVPIATAPQRPESIDSPVILPNPSKVDWPTNESDVSFVKSILGGIDPAQLGAMANLTDGGEIEIKRRESFPDAAIVRTKGNGVTAMRMFRRGPDGKLSVENYELVIDEKSPYRGHGAEMFANQVAALRNAGVSEITTFAAGDAHEAKQGGYNGYYTWPRLGYDGPVPPKYLAKMPDELRAKVSSGQNQISAVMSTPEGRDWWKKNGGGVRLSFALQGESKNIASLTKYLSERKANDAKRQS